MKLIGIILVIVLTLLWTIIVFGQMWWNGNIFALIPLGIYLVIGWKLIQVVRWSFRNSEKFDKITNFFANGVFMLERAKAKDENKLKEMLKMMSLPPEQFQRQFRG